MGEHASDEDFLPVVDDAGDESVFVATDVEDGQVTFLFAGFKICMWEERANLENVLKVCSFDNRVPGGQWFLAFGIRFPEESEGFSGNDVH